MTIADIGLIDALKVGDYVVLDRTVPKTDEEKRDFFGKVNMCDYYFMSSNAITMDGELFNIDGFANRVAALCFGPKSVVIVAGMNKVVPNLDAAYHRVRGFSAPANAQRFEINTPCKITGECANCTSEECICNQFVTTRNCKPAGRIKVILVGEDLGI